MEIIRQGQKPEDVQYECDCNNCKTGFVFARREAKKETSDRDGYYMVVVCPVCSKENWVTISNAKKYKPKYDAVSNSMLDMRD